MSDFSGLIQCCFGYLKNISHDFRIGNGQKKALVNSKIIKYPQNDRTDKNFAAESKSKLQSFNSTTINVKQRFEVFERKSWLGASE